MIEENLREVAWQGFIFSTDKTRLDLTVIHTFLASSYWAESIPLEVVKRSIANSLCFGIYKDNNQIGFARIITDFATFAYLADVFVLADYRGQGLSKELMRFITTHSALQGLRRWMLATKDAHKLYEQYGFRPLQTPSRIMEITNPAIYKNL